MGINDLPDRFDSGGYQFVAAWAGSERRAASSPRVMAPRSVKGTAEVERLAADLAVLAEPNRMRMLIELRAGARSAGALASATGMAPSLASHHLAVLLRAGFVARSRSGSHVFYQSQGSRVGEVAEALASVQSLTTAG